VVDGNRVLISASYRTGSAFLEIQPDMKPKLLWSTQELGLHFNTPILHNGHIYGFDGRNEPDASLACLEAATGRLKWRKSIEWEERGRSMSLYRGTLLRADGKYLALGEFGHLCRLDLSPEGCREEARAWLFAARDTWSLPVLSRGLLYVVQHSRDFVNQATPRLLCYSLRGQ
jgi:outer membrane protein assembly factor BamB